MYLVRDNGNNAIKWLIMFDWLRLGVTSARLMHRVCQPFSRIGGTLSSFFGKMLNSELRRIYQVHYIVCKRRRSEWHHAERVSSISSLFF